MGRLLCSHRHKLLTENLSARHEYTHEFLLTKVLEVSQKPQSLSFSLVANH